MENTKRLRQELEDLIRSNGPQAIESLAEKKALTAAIIERTMQNKDLTRDQVDDLMWLSLSYLTDFALTVTLTAVVHDVGPKLSDHQLRPLANMLMEAITEYQKVADRLKLTVGVLNA